MPRTYDLVKVVCYRQNHEKMIIVNYNNYNNYCTFSLKYAGVKSKSWQHKLRDEARAAPHSTIPKMQN